MFSADSVSDQIKQSYILPNQLSKRFYTVQVCFAVDFLWSLLFNFLMDAIQIPIIAEETTLEDLEKIPTVDALTKYCKET